MSAPFGDFRPGEGGFGLHTAPRPRRTAAIVASGWAVAMIVAAIVMVALLVRLTHHRPRVPTLRPTIGPASWIPAPQHGERGLASLEVGEVKP